VHEHWYKNQGEQISICKPKCASIDKKFSVRKHWY